MKKQTFLHKLTNWLAALGFAAVCGCMAVVKNNVEKTSAYTVQKAQESVTFSVGELNNCSYEYLSTVLANNYDEQEGTIPLMQNSYIIYNNENWRLDDAGTYIMYTNEVDYISFNVSNTSGVIGKFIYTDDQDKESDFLYSLTIYSDFFAENMQKSITLSANQLNNNTHEYFANQLNELSSYTQLQSSYIIYQNNVYKYSEIDDSEIYYFNVNDDNISIVFSFNENDNYAKFNYSENNFTDSITIYSTYIANNLNAPFTDGDDIIGGITSGLGLISYLATTFLNGFTGLFWQNNALTNFAMYSLIMLGIAITFSIIKLVLNILRSNTGA